MRKLHIPGEDRDILNEFRRFAPSRTALVVSSCLFLMTELGGLSFFLSFFLGLIGAGDRVAPF